MRDLRSQLRQAEADLEGSQAAAGIAGPRDLEARLERAIGLLTDLPNTLHGLESAEQNRILSTNVDRECRSRRRESRQPATKTGPPERWAHPYATPLFIGGRHDLPNIAT